jgi:hypothetical protein
MDINGPRLKAGKLCKMDVYTASLHQPSSYDFLIHRLASFDGIFFSSFFQFEKCTFDRACLRLGSIGNCMQCRVSDFLIIQFSAS